MKLSKLDLKKFKEELESLIKNYPNISKRTLRASVEQYWFGKNFISAFFDSQNFEGKNVLEIGCAEGGMLKFLTDKGATCTGIELSDSRYNNSLQLQGDYNINYIKGNVLDPTLQKILGKEHFDYIIIRDVIEHIDDKKSVLTILHGFLKPSGMVFISYPAGLSPYAGHQQVSGKLPAKLPFIYLLPGKLYEKYLSLVGVKKNTINYLLQTRSTRVHNKHFYKTCVEVGFTITKKVYYIFRPEYLFRFNLPVLKNKMLIGDHGFHFLTNGISIALKK